jgi:hypothetical protein
VNLNKWQNTFEKYNNKMELNLSQCCINCDYVIWYKVVMVEDVTTVATGLVGQARLMVDTIHPDLITTMEVTIRVKIYVYLIS